MMDSDSFHWETTTTEWGHYISQDVGMCQLVGEEDVRNRSVGVRFRTGRGDSTWGGEADDNKAGKHRQ